MSWLLGVAFVLVYFWQVAEHLKQQGRRTPSGERIEGTTLYWRVALDKVTLEDAVTGKFWEVRRGRVWDGRRRIAVVGCWVHIKPRRGEAPGHVRITGLRCRGRGEVTLFEQETHCPGAFLPVQAVIHAVPAIASEFGDGDIPEQLQALRAI